MLIKSDITITPQHRYFNEVVGEVASVTTICNGGSAGIETEAMRVGTAIHASIEAALKQKWEASLKIEEQLDEKAKNKSRLLYKFALKQRPTNCELSFIFCDGDIKYGGTVDIVADGVVVELKTGKFNQYYIEQVAAYCNALGLERGLIAYFEGDLIKIKELTKQELCEGFEAFKLKLLAFNAKFNEEQLHLSSILKKRAEILAQIKELDEEAKQLADEAINFAETHIAADKIALDGFKMSKVPESRTTVLKPLILEALKSKKPEFFEEKIKKSYWRIS